MTLEDALRLLEERAIRDHYRPMTVVNYKAKLRGFGNYYSNITIEDITLEQMNDYLLVRRRRDKLSIPTIYIIRSALIFFYNTVLEKNYDFDAIYKPPFPKLRSVAKDYFTKREFFTKDEISKFLEVSKPPFRLVFALMYHFELGREVLELKVQDVERQADGGTALNLPTRERSQKLPTCLSKELHDYLSDNKPTKWLFEVTKSKQLSAATMHAVFNKSLMVAGIHKKLTPRSLIVSHIEHSRQVGADLIDQILSNKTRQVLENFVDTKQIDELRQIQRDRFDLRKLIQLCEELNGCYTQGWFFATSFLQRAILDHVPPIFGYSTFSEVANNHSGGKSFKAQMEYLENFTRKTADGALHGTIRKSEVLLNQMQVDFKSPLGTLIAEIIRTLK